MVSEWMGTSLGPARSTAGAYTPKALVPERGTMKGAAPATQGDYKGNGGLVLLGMGLERWDAGRLCLSPHGRGSSESEEHGTASHGPVAAGCSGIMAQLSQPVA